MSLTELEKTDFYTFFNLREIKPTKSSSDSIIFKPGGFQEYITIEINIDGQKSIYGAHLFLDREWVGNSESINPFGKDIVKSFIGTFILSKVNHEFRDSLITSLWNMKGTKDTIICIDKVVKGWEDSNIEIKDFLDVYRNLKKETKKTLAGYELIISNVQVDDKKFLKIIIRSI